MKRKCIEGTYKKTRLYILANLYAFDLVFDRLVNDYTDKDENKRISYFNSKCSDILDYYKALNVIPRNIREIYMEKDETGLDDMNIMLSYEERLPLARGTNHEIFIMNQRITRDISSTILELTRLVEDINVFEEIVSYFIVALSDISVQSTKIQFTGGNFNKLKYMSPYIIAQEIWDKLTLYFGSSDMLSEFSIEFIDDGLVMLCGFKRFKINIRDRISILDI